MGVTVFTVFLAFSARFFRVARFFFVFIGCHRFRYVAPDLCSLVFFLAGFDLWLDNLKLDSRRRLFLKRRWFQFG